MAGAERIKSAGRELYTAELSCVYKPVACTGVVRQIYLSSGRYASNLAR